ncbi:MAG: type I-C CRISPR-associated protein Cas8c/Csd1 [Christensenellales bacterium]|jgi:CRISPR-associated protein Csd1
MILQALVAHYEALASQGQIARPGWEKGKASYALHIDEEGRLRAVLPLKTPTADGKRMVARDMELPAGVKRTVGITANFLCDNAAYFLGIGDPDKPERALSCFEAAKKLHHALLAKMGSHNPCAKAVCSFFEQWDVAIAREHPMFSEYMEDFESGANIVFFFRDGYAQQDPEIKKGWQAYYERDKGGEKMPCLVTGNPFVPEAVHPSIKGVFGAQSSGAALVAFNAPAYCSFEREQSHNAPMGKYAAFAYTAALNHLLADRKHTKRIGDSTVVYWAQGAERSYQDAFTQFMDRNDDVISDQDLDDLMAVVAKGGVANWEGIPLLPTNCFYVLALAPNAARLSVRFFLRDDFSNIVRHLQEHYERIRIAKDHRSKFENIPLWALLRETINEKSTDKSPSPQMAGDTLRAVLTGGRYPATLYQQTQLRIRAERTVSRGRAAIIKGYLLKNAEHKDYKEVLWVELNEQTTYQPYILGRLFAVLVEVQDKASGVSTIHDKYFTSACATPAVIFPMVMGLAGKHLRKLDGGIKTYYAKQIGELTRAITKSYPAYHDLYDQGIFQLGYYHQTQKRYQKKNGAEPKKEEIEYAGAD